MRLEQSTSVEVLLRVNHLTLSLGRGSMVAWQHVQLVSFLLLCQFFSGSFQIAQTFGVKKVVLVVD